MEANINRTKKISETFASEGGAERTITYHVTSKGQHAIRIYLPCGEDIAPDYYAFDSIEQARNLWRTTVTRWKGYGMIPAAQYWAALRAKVAIYEQINRDEEAC